jgi:hypothetical protein
VRDRFARTSVGCRPHPRRAPRLESLEDRLTPTTARFGIDGAWTGGFQAHITLTNDTAAPINNWVLAFNYGPQITDMWNGSLVSSGPGHYTVDNASYNGSITPGTSVTVGFLATGDPTAVPSS